MAKTAEIINPRKLADPFLTIEGAALAVGYEPERVAELADAGTVRSFERAGTRVVSYDDLTREYKAGARERLAEKIRRSRETAEATAPALEFEVIDRPELLSA